MNRANEFQPDWVSAPGETIADLLEERNLPTGEFARRMGQTPAQAHDLLVGREPITNTMALKLQEVLGASAAFWINRESQYRKDVARLGGRVAAKIQSDWLSELPIKDMIKFGWISPASSSTEANERACLEFFNVPDVGAWRDIYCGTQIAAFRTTPSFNEHPGAVAAWLRKGEIEAMSINCKPWDPEKFKQTLPKIRALTWRKSPDVFLPKLTDYCAACGVAVVIVRAPTGCRASGATRFLSSSKALLLLSFRYLSDDHFWFTFFHEAGHLLLHGKDALFLEGADMAMDEQEEEANKFAVDTLVPPEHRTTMLGLPRDGRAILKFARSVGISPGIIVGQLQHSGRLQRNQFNALKRRFLWRTVD